jgi:hypothetical protein
LMGRQQQPSEKFSSSATRLDPAIKHKMNNFLIIVFPC